MPLIYVSGDPTLTQMQFLAFGHNVHGKLETYPLEADLHRAYPAAFSMYHKQCRAGRITTGDYWQWRESKPHLLFMVIRESPVGATRLRFVQSALLKLARDYRREGIQSIALAPLGRPQEMDEVKKIIEVVLRNTPLRVMVYERYEKGIPADEYPAESDES